ncbi:MAG: hypothetical protein ABIR54_09700 [Burkholderiaceae bacterium]
MTFRLATLACTLLVAPVLALAQADTAPVRPVVQLGVDVPPYYVAGSAYGEPPKVAVDPAYDALLSSKNPQDIVKARDAIAAKPDLVKPQTLIVLAMRLYEIGLRDEAVFWYYAGRDRFLTMEMVLDMRSMQLVRSAEIVASFERAAGPAMDGYAYCSVAHQAEREDRAIDWVAAHPYKILGYTELPAQSEDRNAALAGAVVHLREASKKKKALLADPATLKELQDARLANHSHERYCFR